MCVCARVRTERERESYNFRIHHCSRDKTKLPKNPTKKTQKTPYLVQKHVHASSFESELNWQILINYNFSTASMNCLG